MKPRHVATLTMVMNTSVSGKSGMRLLRYLTHRRARTGRSRAETMKARILTALILICCFILAPAVPGARADQWYQGQPGMWYRHGNKWEWKGKQGDEWFEGKRGHWYAEPGNKWYWLGDDGRQYREGPHGWEWTGEHHRHHRHHD